MAPAGPRTDTQYNASQYCAQRRGTQRGPLRGEQRTHLPVAAHDNGGRTRAAAAAATATCTHTRRGGAAQAIDKQAAGRRPTAPQMDAYIPRAVGVAAAQHLGTTAGTCAWPMCRARTRAPFALSPLRQQRTKHEHARCIHTPPLSQTTLSLQPKRTPTTHHLHSCLSRAPPLHNYTHNLTDRLFNALNAVTT